MRKFIVVLLSLFVVLMMSPATAQDNAPPLVEKTQLVPAAPSFVDKCGSTNDRVVMPESDQTEVLYDIGVEGDRTVVVAKLNPLAANEFEIVKGSLVVWSFSFSDKPCDEATLPPESNDRAVLSTGSTTEDIFLGIFGLLALGLLVAGIVSLFKKSDETGGTESEQEVDTKPQE